MFNPRLDRSKSIQVGRTLAQNPAVMEMLTLNPLQLADLYLMGYLWSHYPTFYWQSAYNSYVL